MKKTPKSMVINDLQTFLDFQNVAKLLPTYLLTEKDFSIAVFHSSKVSISCLIHNEIISLISKSKASIAVTFGG